MSTRFAAVAAWAAERGVALGTATFPAGGGRAVASQAGRLAADAALAALGLPALGGERRADGRPVWPDGATGSISHGHGVALALAAAEPPGGGPLGLGIDVEGRAALPLDDATAVFDEHEQAWAAAQALPHEAATAIWSAKEAAFKAWNEACDGGLPPVDPQRHVHVTIDPDAGTVRVVARRELTDAVTAPARGARWSIDDLVVVAVTYAPTRSSNPFR